MFVGCDRLHWLCIWACSVCGLVSFVYSLGSFRWLVGISFVDGFRFDVK